jgi:hypothetical protein
MGSVVSLTPSREAVDAAWDAYTAVASPLIDNRKLVTDRDHMNRVARAWRSYQSILGRFDAGSERGAKQGT